MVRAAPLSLFSTTTTVRMSCDSLPLPPNCGRPWMGARQSSVAEDRPRSNSVDGTSPSAPVSNNNASRSVMTASEFLQTIRQHAGIASSSESNDDDDAGPSSLFSGTTRFRSHGLSTSSLRPNGLRSHPGRRSVPLFMMAAEDLTCPVCHKLVPSDEADFHLVMCLTRPRLTYNDDVLTDTKGECSICLDDMEVGQAIARLPCLCIYHKKCIDDWFKRKNCCPEHPGDD